jgi:hypothetical protein
MSRDGMPVLKLDAKHRVGQGIDNGTVHLDLFFFRHAASCVFFQVRDGARRAS